ncbi:hypothetical protein SNE40_019458 [Patella caerulea]|uniref:Exosome complex component 10 homolog n=1 Tax=Patella caerulea TaxID=87958 RepID=A0AAN8PAD5_PATCE
MDESETGTTDDQNKLEYIDDVNVYSQTALKNVLEATKNSNSLPTGDDYDFYSTFRSVRDVLDIESQRILSLIDSLLNEQCIKGRVSRGSSAVEIDDKFDILTEANDHILERIGNNLDEASGIKKTETNLLVKSVETKSQILASWNKKKGSKDSPTSFRLLAAKNTPRPQFKFKDKVDNSSNPFVPLIKEKPNALVPLTESLKVNRSDDYNVDVNFSYQHPYQFEILEFQVPTTQLEKEEPKMSLLLSTTPFTFIDTVPQLETLLTKLQSVTEIAVDLEAHSYRTYQGITCLMQISTRTEDFIVDTLTLRNDLHILNEVFTNPNIVKVLHGADMDIVWLQRDLGLYIVNMFDTGQAARVLNLSRLSLAHLLDVYCQVTAEKQYQLADWRMRPLPEELIRYARTDTHYLLYIYDKLRNELLENGNDQKNLLCSVYDRSKQISLRVYTKPIMNDDSHLELYRKSRKVFDSQQLSSLKQLYAWRDKIARLEDESTGYVLPNHMLLQIASILPREKQGILACCNPIPPIVRQYLNELHAIVMDARSIPVTKKEKTKTVSTLSSKTPTYGDDTSIYCPHDLSEHDVSDHSILNLDTKFVATTASMFQSPSSFMVTSKPLITAFSPPEISKRQSKAMKKATEITIALQQPFDMFLPGVESKCKTKWLLKPSTIKTKEPDETAQPEYIAPAKRKRPQENTAPLRHQVFQQKKPKLEPKEEVSEQSVKEKKKTKPQKDKSFKYDNFKPFDYKNVDKSIFDGNGSKKQHKRKK